jgi:hypothetical protein
MRTTASAAASALARSSRGSITWMSPPKLSANCSRRRTPSASATSSSSGQVEVRGPAAGVFQNQRLANAGYAIGARFAAGDAGDQIPDAALGDQAQRIDGPLTRLAQYAAINEAHLTLAPKRFEQYWQVGDRFGRVAPAARIHQDSLPRKVGLPGGSWRAATRAI